MVWEEKDHRRQLQILADRDSFFTHKIGMRQGGSKKSFVFYENRIKNPRSSEVQRTI
ncbi:hypothetical protein C943_00221 [Mariniradius saccharolyticus AK6]|uniref:Uncharacterized protein n=1 Tax=Mariniradius saccharolyticus AK6 TaxID=1239962 RepID=M7XLV0_9BACT|nr:hypothetical protein C943_00221 [Mariniradius saccharolyticus AK6]